MRIGKITPNFYISSNSLNRQTQPIKQDEFISSVSFGKNSEDKKEGLKDKFNKLYHGIKVTVGAQKNEKYALDLSQIADIFKLSNRELTQALELCDIPERGEKQFDFWDIMNLEKLEEKDFKKAEPFFKLPGIRAADIETIPVSFDDKQIKKAKKIIKIYGDDSDKLNFHRLNVLSRKLNEKQINRVQKFIYSKGRCDSQLSESEIISFANLNDDELKTAEPFLYLPARGNYQLNGDDIARLAYTLNPKGIQTAKMLAQSKARKNCPFNANDIINLLPIPDEKLNEAKKLFYIPQRKKQFSGPDIANIMKLSNEEYEKAQELLYVPERGDEQFNGSDISILAKLNQDDFNRAKMFFSFTSIKASELAELAIVLDDKQAKKNLDFFKFLKENYHSLDGEKIQKSIDYRGIKLLGKCFDNEEAFLRLDNQHKNVQKNYKNYINGEHDEDDVKDLIYIFFTGNYPDLFLFSALFDKETLDVLFRMRLEGVEDYIDIIDGFEDEEINLVKNLSESLDTEGKPFTPSQKIEFINLVAAYQDNELDYTKMKEMIQNNKIDIEQLNTTLLKEIMKKCGLKQEEIDSISKEKLALWDIKYVHLLAQEMQSSDGIEDFIKIANIDDFNKYIHDTTNDYGKANEKTKGAFSQLNMDYEKWLHPSKANEIQFKAVDENQQQLTQISKQVEEDMNALMQSPVKGFIEKQFPKFIDEEDKFVIPDEISSSKAQLTDLLNVLTNTSPDGQLAQIWNRAQKNALSTDEKVSIKAKNTLTILNHLNQRIDDISKVKDVKTTKNLDLTIKMWDRIPQKDIFQGNYSTCCIGMGDANGASMPHYIMNTAFNMIELVDNNTGKTVGNALCYFVSPNNFWLNADDLSQKLRVARRKGEHSNGDDEAAAECDTRLGTKKSSGEQIFIIDNIEINNKIKPSNKVGKNLRDSIVEYAQKVAKDVTGSKDTPIYMGVNYNDVPYDDLKSTEILANFIGNIESYNVYLDCFDGWAYIDDLQQSDIKLYKLK